MKLCKYILLTIITAIIFGAFSAPALAAPAIDVTFGPEFAINQVNIMPGDAIKGTFTVTNLTDSAQNLAINFNVKGGSLPPPAGNLEDTLLVQIKKPNGNFAVLPNGTDRQIMGELAGNPFQFDILPGPAGNTRIYKLWITFDPNAGNEYQNQTIIFDISAGLKITATPEDGDDGDDDDDGDENGGDDNKGGPAPPTLFLTGAPAGGAAGGEIGGGGEEGTAGEEVRGAVAGEEECIPYPRWVFILMFVIYLALMIFNVYSHIKRNDTRIRWCWEAFWTIMALLLWYWLDRCRTNVWFVYFTIIAGFIIYLFYLYLLKKKLKAAKVDKPTR